VIEAIDKEGRAQAKRADEVLVDSVIVAGAAEAEHHEIAVYEWLVTEADALGHDTVAGLLRENLQQEQHTLEEIKRLTRSLAPRPAARTP
jgi:ferritin-like metal-binding protein YciE